MAMSLGKVFSKNGGNEGFHVLDNAIVPIAFGREAFLRALYPKDTEQKLSIPQKLVVDVTLQSLQKKDMRQKAVPRLPHVIPKLLKSLRDPDSSAKDYVQLISKDPVLASAVLKLANSVYFNPIGKRIDDIEAAVVKLGIDGVRSVLSAAVMQPIIQKKSSYFAKAGQQIWQHSLCCAVACEQIAEHLQLEKFKVYILGLVHDIGTITLFSELCKQFELNGEELKPGYNAFVPPIKSLSHALSYWIAKDWELPKEICKALAEQSQLTSGNEISSYGYVLYQANMAAEIFASVYPRNKKKALAVLDDWGLPHGLFTSMEQLLLEL